jgi:hypothetical protein
VDAAVIARLLAAGRLGVGLALLLAPGRSTTVWFGEDSDHESVRLATRALGAREVGLGLGAMSALREGRLAEARRWVTAGVAADAVDAVLTSGFSDRPGAKRGPVAAVATSAAVTGLWLRSRLR